MTPADIQAGRCYTNGRKVRCVEEVRELGLTYRVANGPQEKWPFMTVAGFAAWAVSEVAADQTAKRLPKPLRTPRRQASQP